MPTPAKYPVKLMDTSNMDAWREIEPILKMWARKLKLPIYCHNQHGRYAMPPHPQAEQLTIYFWSHPAKEAGRIKEGKTYDKACGFKLGAGQDDGCAPDLDYDTLYDQDEQAVAQVAGNTLYVLFDLPHIDRYEAADVYNNADLMDNIMALYQAYLKDEAYQVKRAQRAEADLIRAVENLVNRSRLANIAEWKRQVRSYEANLFEYNRAMQAAARGRAETQAQIVDAEAGMETMAGKGERELAALRRIPGLVKVQALGGSIVIDTDLIRLATDTGVYAIGEFQVTLGPDGVKAHNKTRHVSSSYGSEIDHPHILKDALCLGNLSELAQYAADGELAVAVNLLMELLHSYNPRDQFAPIDKWPLDEAATKDLRERLQAPPSAAEPTQLPLEPATTEPAELLEELELDVHDDDGDELEDEEIEEEAVHAG